MRKKGRFLSFLGVSLAMTQMPINSSYNDLKRDQEPELERGSRNKPTNKRAKIKASRKANLKNRKRK